MKGIKIALNPVWAGLKRPPEQSAEKRNLRLVTKTEILLFAAIKIKTNFLAGGHRDPPLQQKASSFQHSRGDA